MTTIYNLLLGIHIIAGFSALALGAMAMISTKGSKNHLISGKWFVISMFTVGFSAIFMSYLKPNQFLFAVAIFSMYLTYSGNKAIWYFRLKEAYSPNLKDYAAPLIALICSMYMIVNPLINMFQAKKAHISVMLVFGLILLLSCITDFKLLSKKENFSPRNKNWLFRHIGTIGGAYIATITAFLVTNIRIEMWRLVWLSPTAIGTILISSAIRSWKTKLQANQIS